MGITVAESQGFPTSAEELARRIEIDVLPVLRSDKRLPASIVNAIVHAANRLTVATRADGPMFRDMPGDGEEITVADFFSDIRVVPDEEMKRMVAEIKSKAEENKARQSEKSVERGGAMPCKGCGKSRKSEASTSSRSIDVSGARTWRKGDIISKMIASSAVLLSEARDSASSFERAKALLSRAGTMATGDEYLSAKIESAMDSLSRKIAPNMDAILEHISENPSSLVPGPTRASCIECVEKHIGAALVLMGEERDGYAISRIRAIGHLFEAEDESQEYQDLHSAIRGARILYQNRGASPDIEAISSLIQGVRDSMEREPSHGD